MASNMASRQAGSRVTLIMVGFLALEAVVAAPDMASPVRREVPAVKGWVLLSAGLVPLRWALACLLAGIGSGTHSPAEVARIRDQSATFVTRHGGNWSSS